MNTVGVKNVLGYFLITIMIDQLSFTVYIYIDTFKPTCISSNIIRRNGEGDSESKILGVCSNM